ncbi:MATE family efflux transporter [Cellvibrio mixtus]|uniref:MATE family efflux transporter n=1 Tax=Cellvibrio mixtus TaxID=39650 RepID=A0A266Q8E7_9GAMM|nr:MATE family efflux transporter [Cellvibrio mixtus]OZY86128.1 MATE family efflux transporter [Cellvibrio mixtus]
MNTSQPAQTSHSPLPNTSHSAILRLAFPIILANAAVPLLGLVDTAVIGHQGTAADVGAIAFGSLIFSFVFWGFGFLRMGTSGFTAQAAGAGDYREVRAAYGRALLLGSAIGLLLILLQYPLSLLAFGLLDGSDAVEQGAQVYLHTRIWGAPATLATYAIMGTLIGLGHTRQLLWLQLLLNGLNLLLDVVFVVGSDWGVRGIALGTVIAEWICVVAGAWILSKVLRNQLQPAEPFFNRSQIFQRDGLLNTLKINSDIMWRTLFMLTGFGWFANQGAQFGDTVLAANYILLQFLSFAAFFLDGFAFALESLVGKAIGARNRSLFDRVIVVSTQIAALCATGLMLLLLIGGPQAINALNPHDAIRQQAHAYLPYAAAYVLLSFMAFQLDGIFIGATASRAMRNAAFVSLLIFLGTAWILVAWAGNQGLWLAFILYVIARALTLGIYLPGLRRQLH